MSIHPQIRDITSDRFIAALERDHFIKAHGSGSHAMYHRECDNRNVLVKHTKAGETYAPKTLESMIKFAGWESEVDFMRVKLIKPRTSEQRKEAKESKELILEMVLAYEASKQ